MLNRETLPLPDDLASAMDLTPHDVLAVFGSEAAPTGYLTALPDAAASLPEPAGSLRNAGPETILAVWRQSFERVAPLGFRPVVYEPQREPGALDQLRREPRVLDPAHGLTPSPSSTEHLEESARPVYRNADDVLQAAAGTDIEDTLLAPRDEIGPDSLADLNVPAEQLVQLPSGPTARTDHAAGIDDDRVLAAPELLLALVRAADPGEALARIYLGGGDLVQMLAILRSWHRRFGAELLQVRAEAVTLELWVPRPPAGREARYRAGEEARAFWPPVTHAWGDDPARIGAVLGDSRVWRFAVEGMTQPAGRSPER